MAGAAAAAISRNQIDMPLSKIDSKDHPKKKKNTCEKQCRLGDTHITRLSCKKEMDKYWICLRAVDVARTEQEDSQSQE